MQYIERYIEEKRNIIASSTLKRYKVHYHFMLRFDGSRQQFTYSTHINNLWIKEFITYAKSQKYSTSTIQKCLQFVQNTLNYFHVKTEAYFAYRLKKTSIELKASSHVITLTEEELLMIYQTPVPEELQAAKDWLLISCYTGQRISDFLRFRREMIFELKGIQCITFTQKKTHKNIVLALHPIVLQILEHNHGLFPRKLDEVRYNKDIKQVAKLAGIFSKIITRKRINFRKVDGEYEKWELITSHIGRRSFATNFFGRIPTPILLSATGHSSEEMFMKYINNSDTENTVQLSMYFDQFHSIQTTYWC